MQNATEQIKERLSVVDVLSTYLKLEPTGQNYKARCPFHNEKTASFFVSPGRGSYYCFGCGVKGDIFSFVQAIEGLDFKGALKLLADKAGITLDRYKDKDAAEKEQLFDVMEAATALYERELAKPANKSAMDYLVSRGLTAETIARFRIGFAPDGWRTISNDLASKKYSEQLLEKAGLIKKSERGFYERFRNRVMFPIFDGSGRVIAFSGRTMAADDEHTPKYLNSPDTVLFDKSSALYGIDRAKESIRKKDYAIIVEGQFDLLLSHQAGILNTVAASGTALSDAPTEGDRGVSNLQMLSRLSKNILFAFDGDTAGINAAYRGGLLALGLGMDVKIAKLPEKKDPADVIRESKDAWLAVLKDTKPAILFFADRIMSLSKDSREQVKLIHKLVLPMVARIESALLQEHFLKDVAAITSLSVEALKIDLARATQEAAAGAKEETTPEKKTREEYTIGERLYGIVLWQEEMKLPFISAEALHQKIVDAVGAETATVIRALALERKDELIFEAEAGYADPNMLEREFIPLLHELEVRELKKKLSALTHEIRTAEQKGEDAMELMKKVDMATKRLNTLQSQKQLET